MNSVGNEATTITTLVRNEQEPAIEPVTLPKAQLEAILKALPLQDRARQLYDQWLQDPKILEIVSLTVELTILSWWRDQLAHSNPTLQLDWGTLLSLWQTELRQEKASSATLSLARRLDATAQRLTQGKGL
jgi:hypothetical protein